MNWRPNRIRGGANSRQIPCIKLWLVRIVDNVHGIQLQVHRPAMKVGKIGRRSAPIMINICNHAVVKGCLVVESEFLFDSMFAVK